MTDELLQLSGGQLRSTNEQDIFVRTPSGVEFTLIKNEIFSVYDLLGGWMERYGAFDHLGREVLFRQDPRTVSK